MLKHVGRLQKIVVVFLLITSALQHATHIDALPPQRDLSAQRVTSLFPTKIVRITPPYGYVPGPVKVRLSQSERVIVRRLQSIATQWTPTSPTSQPYLIWQIEESARSSRTLRLSIRALEAARELLAIPDHQEFPPVVVNVGRTQEFIKRQVVALNCSPNHIQNGEQYLMGATICNRRVIVINLTGYFFLRSANQVITLSMERRREPVFRATLYTTVDRNLSGLAHEWVHVARNQLTDGFVPDNEPAWFREGLAETISGLSRVRASNGRMSYMDFHVIRLRKFSNWSRNCIAPLRSYRDTSITYGGCEYLRGAAALELLLANYGGLPKIFELFSRISDTSDFFSAFRQTYGLSVTRFEKRADTYARYIRYVSVMGV